MKILILRVALILVLCSIAIGQYAGSIKTAKMHEIQKNWDSAISIYNDVLSKSPNNYQAIRSLKNVYRKSQRYGDGINFLTYQLSRNPKDIQLTIELGEFYFLNEKINDAKKVWSDGLLLFSNNRSYYRLLFSTYDKYSLSDELFQMIEKGREEFNNSFLSIELGNYYQKRKQFKNAIEEYVLSLFSNPGNSSSVSRRILIMGDDIDSKNVIEIKLLEMSNSNPVLILPILSDHYFKHREFKKSFDTLLELTEIENFSAKKWLSFSNNLRREKAYSLAVKAYQFALKKDLKAYQYGEGLLGLAKTFEDQIFPIEKNDIIPFFYNDNIFFEDAFQLYTNISSENLAYSLSIYDSVLTSIPESAIACEAEFRLAEIQYRVMEDFDKALNLYKSSLSKCRSKKLKEQSILKIADVHLSKGDFISSIKFLDSSYSTYEIPEIKNKLIEMYLFSGSPDTALTMINNSFETIMPTDKYFNDLMELRDFINHYYVKVDDKGKKVFKDYLRSESLLKQRKIFEANQLLEFIQINNNNEIISPLISLRRSIILIRLKKYDDALNQLNTLNGSIYSDRGIIMSGQIHEQFYGEPSKALEYYMRIINDYSDSIFSEPIRYHLRKMKKNEKI